MYERFIDRKDRKNLIKNSPDFKLRRHGPPPVRVVFCFVAALLAIFILIGHLVIKLLFLPDNQVTPNDEILVTLLAVGFCLTAAGVFAIILIYRIRDLILETEFQNLVFASSMRINTDFCLVLNNERMVIYCDYNFSQLFSYFDNHSKAFDVLLSNQGLKKADKDKLAKALKGNKTVEVPLALTKPNGDTAKMKVSLLPVNRPAGYFILKGKKVK